MDLPILRKCLDFSRRNKNWLLLIAAFGASGYGAYKAYNSPYLAQKRKRFVKLLRAFVSVAELISNSADTVNLISNDLNQFLASDSDQIPNSLKQLSKLATSNEFSASLARVSEALTLGILLGYKRQASDDNNRSEISADFSDRVLEKLFSKAGTGFMSVVVGSFARNLVLSFVNAESVGDRVNERSQLDVPGWVNVICDERCGKLIGDCVQVFVSTAVAVFLDKSMDVNTYDEMFAGLSNPKHQEKVKGVLVSVCNGAVETFVRTSHQVLTNSSVRSNSSSSVASVVPMSEDGCLKHDALLQQLRIGSSVSQVQDVRWLDQIKSTLSVPANRRFVLDVTGRVTFETVRSFVAFFLWRISEGFKKSVSKVHDEVVDKGLEVVKFVGAKSSVILTLYLALYLHIMGGSSILLPA
ncbi:protein PHLOEM PROTEIN 2-LIKE A10-like isoform X1 [Abrus precatorius]|uniref:Protein PHLOEM PROTEIN 2-LIKE A10-like isoform X1 n=1 Tax=Abrus precatorius TaxID=3816 RepID=A0A8B8LHY3_ABRPR|nr:protein PHLOEM PROTEIN 2-LIKE A10-like isoform X1 [Abrus precatorius]